MFIQKEFIYSDGKIRGNRILDNACSVQPKKKTIRIGYEPYWRIVIDENGEMKKTGYYGTNSTLGN